MKVDKNKFLFKDIMTPDFFALILLLFLSLESLFLNLYEISFLILFSFNFDSSSQDEVKWKSKRGKKEIKGI